MENINDKNNFVPENRKKSNDNLKMSVLKEKYLPNLTNTNDFFKNRSFLEPIDEKKLYALVKSTNVLLTTKKWWEDRHSLFPNGEIHNEQNFIKLMYKTLVKIDNTYYVKASYFSKCKVGRVYPSKMLSQGIIRRQVRHFLCKDDWVDIDIINCHPNILRWLCGKVNIKCPMLTRYCKKRDKVLQAIMKESGFDRDTTKTCFISLMNGGKLTNYLIENGASTDGNYEFLDKFDKEMRNITKKNN